MVSASVYGGQFAMVHIFIILFYLNDFSFAAAHHSFCYLPQACVCFSHYVCLFALNVSIGYSISGNWCYDNSKSVTVKSGGKVEKIQRLS